MYLFSMFSVENRRFNRMTAFFALFACAVILASGCASDNQRLQKLIAEVRASQGVPDVPGPVLAGIDRWGGGENPAEPLQILSRPAKLTVQPETVVDVSVEEDRSLSGTYEVNNASAIQFGYAGLVFLGNMTEDAARDKIRDLLMDRGFRTATVALRIVKSSYDTIRVSGWVNEPADLKIGPGSMISLNDALLRAKGLRQAKGIKIIIAKEGLLNPIPLSGKTNEEYTLLGTNGKPSLPLVQVGGNDWIHVSTGDEMTGIGEKQILVVMLEQPGMVRFSNTEPCTMMYLLIKIGTLQKWVDTGNVLVIRKGQDGIEQETKVDVRPILKKGDPEVDVPLEHGDRVIFKERRLPFW